MGVLGLWEPSIETLALIVFAVLIALVIGIPFGIWAGRRPAVERVIRPVLDAMQTIPAFSYLVPVVLLFGIGVPTALIATVIFAHPARDPPDRPRRAPGARDVARGAGVRSARRRARLLRRVQLPLAKPAILLGVNQTIMMALGIVVIAASVGVGGLGQVVLDGLNNLNVGVALAGGLAIVALAIVLDRTTLGVGRPRPQAARNRPPSACYGREISRLAADRSRRSALVAVAVLHRSPGACASRTSRRRGPSSSKLP